MGNLAVVRLCRDLHAATQEVEPSDYLKASGELLFLCIVQAWILCLIAKPEQFEHNQLKTLFGYNNPCVAWDVPPALYTSTPLFILCICCSIQYAFLDSRRSVLTPGLSLWKTRAKFAANWTYALSMCFAGLLFVITPDDDVYAHTALFVQLMVSRLLMVAANYLEAEQAVLPSCWAYLAIYSLFTGCSSVFAIVTLAMRKQIIPTGLMMAADFGWFVMLPLTTVFFPQHGGWLRIHSELVPEPLRPTKMDLLCCRRCLPVAVEDAAERGTELGNEVAKVAPITAEDDQYTVGVNS